MSALAEAKPVTRLVKTSNRGAAPGERRGGRERGVPNKLTATVKAAIIEAFGKAGGVEYLLGLATSDPRTFCSLLGKTVPTTVSGDEDSPILTHSIIEYRIVRPRD